MLTFRQTSVNSERATSLTDAQHTALREGFLIVIVRKCSCCRQWQGCCLCNTFCSAAPLADSPMCSCTNNGKQTCPLYSLSLFLAGSLFHPLFVFLCFNFQRYYSLLTFALILASLCIALLPSQFFNQTMKWLQRLAEQSPPHCSSEVLMWKEGKEQKKDDGSGKKDGRNQKKGEQVADKQEGRRGEGMSG